VKNSFKLGVCVLVLAFAVCFVVADNVVLLQDGTAVKNATEDATFTLNISINVTSATNVANISMINITLPINNGINYSLIPNGTSLTGNYTVSNATSDVISWRNVTYGLIGANSTQYFWVNMTATAPGTYTINVTVVNGTQSYVTGITLIVNDVTYPLVNRAYPTAGLNTSSTTRACLTINSKAVN
jgi:hypothetical protein